MSILQRCLAVPVTDRLAPPVPRPGWLRVFLPLFLALALAISFCNRESFFRAALYEEGDDAANALQIYRAKHFQELHGNYSRWGFHHPGPAFFYVYALGEWLLCDLTHIAPAPHNAHLYTGALLQLAFYSAALALLARHSRQPLLVIALALGAGALHYQTVPRVLFSVWPPDVLLMPFLCFVVACAAVATADLTALPLLVISGSFLVHGHIAQPLFVVPMTLVALGWAWRQNWRGIFGSVLRSASFVLSAGLLALFLLPLLLDLLAGKNSNAHDVLLHLRYQTDDGNTLFKSLLCYGASFVGLDDPTMFNQLDATTRAPFVEHARLLAGWLTLLGASAWWFWRRPRDRTATDDTKFGRCLLAFWLVASGLTLIWGMRQDGGFTNFNSRFNHSLVHVIALLAIVALAGALPRVLRSVGWSLAFVGVASFTLALPFVPNDSSRGDEVAANLRGLLRADPHPAATKLITFSSDDWYEAVTLGRAFQRLGIAFLVHPSFRILFGDDKILSSADEFSSPDRLSVWQVVNTSRAPNGAHRLNRECSVIFPQAAPLGSPAAQISFSANAHAAYAMFGIGTSESDGWAWTDARVAELTFTAPPVARDLNLILDAEGQVTPYTPHGQRVKITVNGQLIGDKILVDRREVVQLVIGREVWNRSSPQTIVLELPDAIAPSTVGGSGDRRLLALRLHSLSFEPVALP